ncbi:WAP1-like protein 1 [Thermus thermophilus]|nr:WAP1-like protein 1 [Thermus thermophilus]
MPVEVGGLGKAVFQGEAHRVPGADPEGGPGKAPPVGEEGGPLPRQGKRGGGGRKLQGEEAALAPHHLGLGEGRALGPGQAQDQTARRRLEKAPALQHAL